MIEGNHFKCRCVGFLCHLPLKYISKNIRIPSGFLFSEIPEVVHLIKSAGGPVFFHISQEASEGFFGRFL